MARTKEENRIYQKELYHRNADWRQKKIDQALSRYYKIKAEKQALKNNQHEENFETIHS